MESKKRKISATVKDIIGRRNTSQDPEFQSNTRLIIQINAKWVQNSLSK